MKKTVFFFPLMTILVFTLYSQVDFSGNADISLAGNIPESNGYESLFNPANINKIKDTGIDYSLMAKLDGGDDKTTFSSWFSLKDNPSTDNIFTLDLMRLSVNVYLGDNFSLEVGRQSMLTGYGYGWNPTDLANPLKNPTDPNASLRGVDGLSLKMYLGNRAALKLYGIMPEELNASGLSYQEIKGGGEVTLNTPGFEVKFNGLYDYDSTQGSDAYTSSVGTGFMADLWGMGVYGEAALRQGSRNKFANGTVDLTRKTDTLYSVLAGLEYTFESELYAVLEYFYNGEGYSKTERSDFEDSLIAGAPLPDMAPLYSSGYFARHYTMINLRQGLYDINTDLNFAAIFSPDSGALMLMPTVNYTISENFAAKLSYVGMVNCYENEFTEISAQPVKHIISTTFTYSF